MSPPKRFSSSHKICTTQNGLVIGGERLAGLKVGAFDVEDLYRAAWVQAVAALDHWVTREIVERAVSLAEQPKAARPPVSIYGCA
jgi:hypothetical protein